MIKTTIFAASAMTLAMAASALAQPPAPGPAVKGATSLTPPADAPPEHTAAPGPFAVSVESDPSLPTHTLYRPTDLKPFTGSKRLPIIAWGNGACSNAGQLFSTFLTQIASHGYFIVVSGPKDAPLPAFAGARARQAAAGARIAKAGDPPQPMTKDEDMRRAIDWALKENVRKGSAYFGKLDPSKIAVMGQSCGGLQAIANAGDPRLKTVMVWNSGVFPPASAPRGISGATKESLAKFHTPVAYIMGGPADAAYVNTLDDVSRIRKVPVFQGWINVGHGGTYDHPGGGWFGEVAVHWLDWRLKGDRAAGKWFEGADCILCKNPIWHIDKKNMK